MNIRTSWSRAGTRNGSVKVWAIGGAVLLLAGAVVVTAERWSQSQSDTSPVAAGRAVTLPASEVAQANQPSAPVYYIVGSAEQAAATLVEIAERNALRFQNGERDIQATVVVAGSTEAEGALSRLLATNHTRSVNGLPEIVVMDLR